MEVEALEVRRVCRPSCPAIRTRNPADCRCKISDKPVVFTVIAAKFDGIIRYKARFRPDPVSAGKVRISNKELYDERGLLVEVGADIPKEIFLSMRRRAAGIINRRAPQL